MAQTKVKLVSDGVITVDNLHTNHGITTDHIGEGSNLYYSESRIQNYLNTNDYITRSEISGGETLTSLSLAANTLSYLDEAGNTTNLDLSLYLDDTNLARLVSGTLDGATGIATFTRDDASTFTVDLSSLTPSEIDPVFTASAASGITLTNISNWDTAYGWGDHASAGYLTSFTETDPTVPSHVKAITTTKISNWDTAYGWGNHASAGYLTSFTETDPTVPSHVKSITTTNVSNWNTAYGWGNHASAGYLTSLPSHTHDDRYYTETEVNNLLSGKLGTSAKAADSDLLDGSNSTYFDHRRYTDSTNYLGGYYVSGGTEKPNNAIFGAGKFKVAMLSGSNLGFGGSWNDVMWVSTYNGGDVKSSHALVFDKYSSNVFVSDQNFDSASWGTGHLLWHSGNDGAGSGLDADNLDGHTWTSSGKSVRATEFYADNWFRNYNAGEGLYNEATGCHFVSDASDEWTIRDAGNSIRIEFQTNGTTLRGSVYADNANSIGFLNNANEWGLRYLSANGNSPNLHFLESGNETWSGNPGNDTGKIEYHSNRMYIVSGANSTEVVRFRRSGDDVAMIDNSGNVRFQGDVTAYSDPSDIRLKEDIKNIENPLDKVMSLNGVTFTYKKDGKQSTGVIAQEVQKVLPEVIYTSKELNTEEEFLVVRYGNMVGLLIEAIKEQQQQIEELKLLINK